MVVLKTGREILSVLSCVLHMRDAMNIFLMCASKFGTTNMPAESIDTQLVPKIETILQAFELQNNYFSAYKTACLSTYDWKKTTKSFHDLLMMTKLTLKLIKNHCLLSKRKSQAATQKQHS